ncbi:signal transduction histidine kinase [Mucilaginibacter gracilis]|uniref:histidine kinase n=1 Tax=Mucilaginibacter gracilis TaxID=423350 RepID=A0A495IY31_9SPHI|nr:HAMP domain-containing sensor histidine kinase [Mucilaginibacter gracilis]RKR81403.1 signal transduction histidine kinase [Mucilaginibacter gracilis]
MDQNIEILQNAQRLRYEAFSRFATDLNKCTEYSDIAKILSTQLKYIINSFIFRVYYRNENSQVAFQGFIGQTFFFQNADKISYSFEETALANGLPIEYPTEKIFSDPAFAETVFTHQKVYSLVTIPAVYSAKHQIVITIATTQDKQIVKPDYKFIQLISDFLANKLSQLLVLEAIAKTNKELEINNKQISSLNQYLDATVKERTLQLTNTNTELKTLLYRTTHDFRAPLANIMGLSNLGTTMAEDPETLLLFKHSKTVAQGLDKMLTKLNGAVIADDESNKKEPIIFADIINPIRHKLQALLTANACNITLTENVTQPYHSYQNILTVIFDNLIDNSINFRNPEKETQIRINVLNQTGHVVVTFTDNGQGIDAEIIPKIFDMYYRGSANSAGHGLGLYIVAKLVKFLKGEIKVESVLNEYTTFTIQLPLF